LLATAAAAQMTGLRAIGIVRGLHGAAQATATLMRCAEIGMELVYVPREIYRRKNDPDYLKILRQQYPNSFLIPEGGANEAGRRGAAHIASMIPDDYTHICVSVGSGTTLAGLRNALPTHQEIIGFAPMKGGQYLEQEIAHWVMPQQNKSWSVTDAYHLGGFGKSIAALYTFMAAFQAQQHIALDMVYTGKMMLGIQDMIQCGKFSPQAKLLCIHTGGVQPR
jgi:1-aminocyclopropane-1-carboxylate deaminase/D-cysteine desulfhydrase-like pyridoxal-dependent ACC family enzyme